MIKKCIADDLLILNEYLYQNKELNLFLISDIENFGFDDTNLDIYMDVDNNIHTVYLRFFNNLCIVSYECLYDLNFINELVNKFSVVNISGERDLLSKIKIDGFETKNCYFSSLDKLLVDIDDSGVSEIKIDNVNDYLEKVDKVFETTSNIETTVAELEKNSKHIFVYREDNKVVSGVSSSAESKELAMLIGVFTIDGYRRRGYAQKCVYAICRKLLNENKTVCLFYDNPNAAKMYEKLGFKFKGYYSILSNKANNKG